jgi:hypothetical protein
MSEKPEKPGKPDTELGIKWERIEPVAKSGGLAMWQFPLPPKKDNKTSSVAFIFRVLKTIVFISGVAALLCVFWALANPTMRPHFAHWFYRWIRNATSSTGTNPLGFALFLSDAFVFLLVTAGEIYREHGWAGMLKALSKERALRSLRIALICTLTIYGPVFTFFLAKSIYDDHRSLVSKNAELVQNNRDLAAKDADLATRVNSVSQKENGDISAVKAEAQQAKDDARHWQEAYERYSHGEQFPDRHLDREDRYRLRDELERVAKAPSNKEYIKIDFAIAPNSEAQHIGFQLYQLFRDAHWNVSKPMELPKDLQEEMQAYGGVNASGIFIFTDQPDKGRYLSVMLGRIGGQSIVVNPRGLPQHYKGLMLWVANKQFTYWKDND